MSRRLLVCATAAGGVLSLIGATAATGTPTVEASAGQARPSAWGRATTVVSVNSREQRANPGLRTTASMSADGRYVVFGGTSSNLVPGDTNELQDVFLRDRRTGTTRQLSLGVGGAPANSHSLDPFIAADGRSVVFLSAASNLTNDPGLERGGTFVHVFVRNLATGTNELVTVTVDGAPAPQGGTAPVLSADGRFVAFHAAGEGLVRRPVGPGQHVYVRDLATGVTKLVSVGPGGQPGTGQWPSLSADGRFVAFESRASLVPGDDNGTWDVFVREMATGRTRRVSVGVGGSEPHLPSGGALLSPSGTFVTFYSRASNLVPGDTTNQRYDAFLRNLRTGRIERVSVSSRGAQANDSSGGALVSDGGRFVVFSSAASNLVRGDTNHRPDVFVRDRSRDVTRLVSVGDRGQQGNGLSGAEAITSDGRSVLFISTATNLVRPNIDRHRVGVYIRSR